MEEAIACHWTVDVSQSGCRERRLQVREPSGPGAEEEFDVGSFCWEHWPRNVLWMELRRRRGEQAPVQF